MSQVQPDPSSFARHTAKPNIETLNVQQGNGLFERQPNEEETEGKAQLCLPGRGERDI